MTTTFKALAASAALAFAVAAPLHAQSSGETMLLSAVMTEVSELGLDTSTLNDLSLNDLVSIATIVNNEDNPGTKKAKIEAIIEAGS